MATRNQKRQRQKQSRAAKQAALLQARKRRTRRNRVIVAGFLAILLILGVVTLVSGGSKSKTKVSTTTPTTSATPVSLPKPEPGETIGGDTPCPKADGSSPRTTKFAKPPPTCIDPARTYTAEIETTKGLITIALDPTIAPKTVNNFVVLARYHFFDGISFHRIIPGFVVQGGDPEETGTGDAGYKFDDELPKSASYEIGSVAMANSGPNTNGSQFFIVSGDSGTQLPPNYSLFGRVTSETLNVVKSIEAVGSPDTENGAPKEVVTMKSVTIKES